MQYYRLQKFPDASDIFMNALYIFVFQLRHTSYDVSTRNINQRRKIPTEVYIVLQIKQSLSLINTTLNHILHNNNSF